MEFIAANSRRLNSSCFPCITDNLSRNEYRKNQTSPRKMSYDSMHSPSSSSWNNNSGSLKPPHLQSRTASRKNNPIMYSNSSGMLKPPPLRKTLNAPLKSCAMDVRKRSKSQGMRIVQEEELLTINVQPGWKKGTKITFKGKGNERLGDGLELGVEIPFVKALTGCTISVPLLSGDRISLTVDEIMYPGYEKIITGQGMSISKEAGLRGNLIKKGY
ncbi:hypothetical protein Lal_00001611 [Lupinus albus]|nr:hypothetical protein Lal_00001611 [Lupinus albus]